MSRWLAGAALKQLIDNPQGREPTDRHWGPSRSTRPSYCCIPGLRFAFGEAGRQIRDAVG